MYFRNFFVLNRVRASGSHPYPNIGWVPSPPPPRSGWAIQFQMHILWFSFTPMSKCRKRPWNFFKYKYSLLKTYFPWPWHTECTSSFFRILAALDGSKQAKDPWLNSSKDNFIAKSFVCPQKGNWAFHWTFSFHLCLLSAYFQSWNAKLWSWKPPHDERAPAILVDGWHLLRCQSISSSTP